VRGWTLDPDTNNPIAAHVYIDGAFAGQVTANANRPDVGAALPFGANHGFDTTVPASSGNHTVCVYGISVAQGGNNRLPCRQVFVS
jgi:hypothetical protein